MCTLDRQLIIRSVILSHAFKFCFFFLLISDWSIFLALVLIFKICICKTHRKIGEFIVDDEKVVCVLKEWMTLPPTKYHGWWCA
jgi:hypothetical protein